MKGHWANECRTSKFHVRMYHELKRSKENGDQGNEDTKPKVNTFMVDIPDFSSQIENHMVIVNNNMADYKSIHCLIDSGSTHSILQDKELFDSSQETGKAMKVTTLDGQMSLVKGYGTATVQLPGGTILKLEQAVYVPDGGRNIISFGDLRRNGYHVATAVSENGEECLHLLSQSGVIETFNQFKNGLYATKIDKAKVTTDSSISSYFTQHKLDDRARLKLWLSRLGHPGKQMLSRLIQVVQGIKLSPKDIQEHDTTFCTACAQGELCKKSKLATGTLTSSDFLSTLFVDICGPITPPSGPFYYFMIIRDGPGKGSEVALLTSRNMSFPRLLIVIIRLQAQFPDYPIKTILFDNAAEFLSKLFKIIVLRLALIYRRRSPTSTTLSQRISYVTSRW
jgi:hypothetical protein